MTDPVGTRIAWIALGSNVGHRPRALAALRSALNREPLRITAASAEVVTRPVGVVRQRDFLNQVVRVQARRELEVDAWLAHCVSAEHIAGRRPTYHWGPRRADADILLLGERGEISVESDEVRVPHPALAQRAFLHALLSATGAPEGGDWRESRAK